MWVVAGGKSLVAVRVARSSHRWSAASSKSEASPTVGDINPALP